MRYGIQHEIEVEKVLDELSARLTDVPWQCFPTLLESEEETASEDWCLTHKAD